MFKTIEVSKKEFQSFDKAEKENHERIFHCVKAMDGEKYLVAHGAGGYIFADDGIGRTSKQMYEKCICLGIIKKGQRINICCCYGGIVDTTMTPNVKMINNTDSVLFINRIKKGSKYYLICYSNNITDKVKAKVFAFI